MKDAGGTSGSGDSDSDGDSDGDTDPACGSCHSLPPSAGEHRKHDNYACATCHSAVLNEQQEIMDQTLHQDGDPNISPSPGEYDPITGRCSNLDCHGSESWGN